MLAYSGSSTNTFVGQRETSVTYSTYAQNETSFDIILNKHEPHGYIGTRNSNPTKSVFNHALRSNKISD